MMRRLWTRGLVSAASVGTLTSTSTPDGMSTTASSYLPLQLPPTSVLVSAPSRLYAQGTFTAPPPEEDATNALRWNVSEDSIIAARTEASSLGLAHDATALFLLAKGVTERAARRAHEDICDAEEDRARSAGTPPRCIATPSPRGYLKWWISSPDPAAAKFQTRVATLLAPVQTSATATPEAMSFAKFTESHQEWADPVTSWVFWRQHPLVMHKPGVLVQRAQLGNPSCYMNAAAVGHHYLRCMVHSSHNNTDRAPTVDVPAFTRRNLALPHFIDFVFHGRGRSTHPMFHSLLQPDSQDEVLGPKDIDQLPFLLTQYGPGVIGNWQVTADFRDPVKWQFIDPPLLTAEETAARQGHAMLVVGWRRTASGEVRVLLQNWWTTKQFLEVGPNYWAAALSPRRRGRGVLFVKTLQADVLDNITTTMLEYDTLEIDACDEETEQDLYELCDGTC